MGSDVLLVLIIVLIAVVIWRGPKTLPKIGQALGRGVREARSEAAKLREDKDGDPPA
jgi:Sec-independent protein translocase protein TatA